MTEPHGSRFPDALVLICGLILLAQLATYVLPAGEFEREGRQVVRGTYHAVAAAPLPIFTFLTAVPAGLADAADIIFFILIVGGVFGVLRATGAIDALIGLAIHRLGGRPVLLVGGMVTLFAVGSSTVGMAEEYMPFVPLLVTMCLALRMDAVVALGIIYIGAGVGYGCAALNPFTVLIGQSIAGLELTSGQGVRWLLLAVCLVIGVHQSCDTCGGYRRTPTAVWCTMSPTPRASTCRRTCGSHRHGWRWSRCSSRASGCSCMALGCTSGI